MNDRECYIPLFVLYNEDKRYIFIFLEHCFALCCALVALKMKGKFLKVGCKGKGKVVGRKLAEV